MLSPNQLPSSGLNKIYCLILSHRLSAHEHTTIWRYVNLTSNSQHDYKILKNWIYPGWDNVEPWNTVYSVDIPWFFLHTPFAFVQVTENSQPQISCWMSEPPLCQPRPSSLWRLRCSICSSAGLGSSYFLKSNLKLGRNRSKWGQKQPAGTHTQVIRSLLFAGSSLLRLPKTTNKNFSRHPINRTSSQRHIKRGQQVHQAIRRSFSDSEKPW